MARMRTRLKKDTCTRVVAMPIYADADSLDGLIVPVDPDLIHRLPHLYRPGDIALTVCIIGLLLLDRKTCPAETLTRLCRLPRRDLKVALARVQGRTADGAPKYFSAELRGQEVLIGAVQTRLTRPDKYVRLPVEMLADAPTAAHVRYFVLAAEAAMGDEQRGRNVVSRALANLGLHGAGDLDDAHAWVERIFRNSLGRQIRHQRAGDIVTITSLNACHWSYDHRAAPRPWMDEADWKRTMLRAPDGRWRGNELTVAPLRAAKVCEWAFKHGCKLGARNLRIHWLLALHQALHTEDDPEVDHTLLNNIDVHGATAAFERWVIAVADQDLGETTLKMTELAEEHRIMRVMAADNPDDRRLRPYAIHPTTGERLCQYQFWRRIVQPLQKDRRAERLSIQDYRYALRCQLKQFSVGGRTPHRPKSEAQPAVISFAALQQVAVTAMTTPYPGHYQPAVDLVNSMVTQGLRRGVKTLEEAIDGMLEDARRSSSYERIATAWEKAVVDVREDGVARGTGSLDALAVRIFRGCMERTRSQAAPPE